MQLYVGKNHQGGAAPVQSIFRLAGSDEDALTFALGFLLAHDQAFGAKMVRHLGISPRKPLKPGCSVYLQEVTDPRFGRRDIVIEGSGTRIEGSGTRIVIEAKVGGAEPTAEQLLKYGAEANLWEKFDGRTVVALSQVKLSKATREIVRSKLSDQGIRFFDVQWHQVIDLVLRSRPSDDSAVSRYLFDQFIRYVMGDYRMGYYDAEILIQDVNLLNAKIFNEGWMYVTNLKDKKAPLYFAPYFTQKGANSGIEMISRVIDSEIVILADTQDVVEAPTDEHRDKWREGLCQIRKRAKKEGFFHKEQRLFYLDRPKTLWKKPLSKKSFNKTKPSKQIPNQIPKGFSLEFDDLLRFDNLPTPSPGTGEP